MNKRFDFRTAYIDLLLNVLTTILFILALAFAMIVMKKSESEEAGIKKDAQFIFTAEWSKDIDCDVDIWVKDPQENIAFFRNQSVGIMNIERDDQGSMNDTLYDTEGNLLSVVTENKEMWTLRGKQPGEFTFNLHLYNCVKDNKPMEHNSEIEVPVTVELYKVNPSYVLLRKQIVVLTRIWEEKTAFVVDMRENGSVEFRNVQRELITQESRGGPQ